MPGHLAIGKPPDQRRSRAGHVVPKGMSVVYRDGETRGPTIEDATGQAEWPKQVRDWWDTWRSAPQAALFEDTDWRRLATVAPLYAAYLARPNSAALAEIRRTEDGLGATFVDRLRARIIVADPGVSETDATVAFVDRMREIKDRLREHSENDD